MTEDSVTEVEVGIREDIMSCLGMFGLSFNQLMLS